MSDFKPAIFSALLAAALYGVTLGGTYVYDDRYIVLSDPRVGDVHLWGEYWTKDYFNGGADNLYRPVVSMSYAIESKLHGRGDDRAWIFHLVNVLLHAGVAALAAELARRITGSSTIALIAGVLFAAHPIHVEAVANIVGRAELMCGLGMFAALMLFLHPTRSIGRSVAIWACFVFAMLSKEQGLLVPLMLLIAIPLRARPIGVESQSTASLSPLRRLDRPDMLLVLLLLWTLASYILFRERILKFWWDRSFLDPTINPLIQSSGIDRALLPVALFGRYAALLFFPARLLPDYGGDAIGSHVHFNDPYFYLGIAAGLAFAAACVVALVRKNLRVLFCLLAFALLYGMVANLLTLIGTNFAERLMYIPSAFLCILAAMAIAKLPRGAMIAVTAVALVLMSARTVTYAARWNDPQKLFETALEQEPRSIRLYLLLAEDQQRRRDIPAARATLARGRAIAPDYYRVWLNSARLELDVGNFDQAIDYAKQAQHVNPTGVGQQLIGLIAQTKRDAATRPTTRPD